MNSNYNPYDPQYGYSQQPVQPQYDPYAQQQYGYSQQQVDPQYGYSYQQVNGQYGYSSQQVSPYQSGYAVTPYQQNQYSVNLYSGAPYPQAQQPKPKRATALGTIGMICGILAILCCTIFSWVMMYLFLALNIVSFLFSIIGIIISAIGKKKGPTGMATAGLVLSILSLIFSLIGIVACGGIAGVALCAAAEAESSSSYDYGSAYSDYYYTFIHRWFLK
ncbi:MAG: hypothetical protein J6L81_06490 [Clostridia bacterium]|nr:hypothetical protein [Clostridia bacterium]